MKKFFYLASLISLFFIASCKENKEQKVQAFSDKFVGYVNANQIDSIMILYPTANFDSIASLPPDSVQITGLEGVYHIDFGSGQWIDVKENEDGSLIVEKSKGLAAFPADKVEMAKKTGMWDSSLTDAELNQRMHDDEFFSFLEAQGSNATDNIITVGRWTITKEWYGNDSPGMATQTVTNNTDQPISGADYEFVMISEDPYSAASGERPRTWTNNGKDIPPHGSISENFEIYNQSAPEIKSIKWNLTPQQLQEKFASYTGREYQEYLDSKK